LPTNKSTGLDNIPCRLLKEAAPDITTSLKAIFDRSIETGVFPDDLKKAKVTPLHKANDNENLENCRPISVIPAVAKVFERLVFNQLYQYFEDNKLLSKYQSGFRLFHSTLYALDATTEWYLNMDQGKVNSVLFSFASLSQIENVSYLSDNDNTSWRVARRARALRKTAP